MPIGKRNLCSAHENGQRHFGACHYRERLCPCSLYCGLLSCITPWYILLQAAETIINIHVVSGSNNEEKEAGGRKGDVKAGQPSVLRIFPFGSAIGCGISLATAAIGCWLLFDSKGSLRSSRYDAKSNRFFKMKKFLKLTLLLPGKQNTTFSFSVGEIASLNCISGYAIPITCAGIVFGKSLFCQRLLFWMLTHGFHAACPSWILKFWRQIWLW